MFDFNDILTSLENGQYTQAYRQITDFGLEDFVNELEHTSKLLTKTKIQYFTWLIKKHHRELHE